MLQDLLSGRLRLPRRGRRALLRCAAERAAGRRGRALLPRDVLRRPESWNLRDPHMFDTLAALLASPRPGLEGGGVGAQLPSGRRARQRRWAPGARSTSASSAARRFGDAVYAIGFGTDHGTVAAASDWDEQWRSSRCAPRTRAATNSCATERASRPSCSDCAPSGELRIGSDAKRAWSAQSASSIGRKPSWRATTSQAHLPRQFDEYVWFDESRAVNPLDTHELGGMPETYPFGL